MQLAFTVFAMFFGAGNLIFPAFLAWQAGENLLLAFSGFAITAIGFPILALIAVEKTDSLENLASRVHPLFSRIFTLSIYLAIGPCLAIPRTASTSYEMVRNAFGFGDNAISIVYSVIFFIAAALIALNPEKLSKRLGRILAPTLIILIIILFAVTAGTEAIQHPAAGEYTAPFSSGFREGYQTMDAIAGLVFGIVIAMNAKTMGMGKREMRVSEIAGGAILLIIYSLLAAIGTKTLVSNPATGADILSGAAAHVSENYGRYLIALIFLLACFNTSVSLLSSTGEYFSRLIPKIKRNIWIAIFALLSCIIANIGLEGIIRISSPVLELIYPGALTLIILSFFPYSEKMRYCYVLSVSAALLASLLSMLGVNLPFGSIGLGWILPSAAAGIAGAFLGKKQTGI